MTIQEVLSNNLCLGCGLCQSIFGKEKLNVVYNEEGFLRPTILQPLTRPEQDLFSKICPGIQVKHPTTKGHNTFLGPYQSIDVGYASDKKIRYNGSSGGVLSGLGLYLLKEGKADCILQIGPSLSQPARNSSMLSFGYDDLINNAGSRYAPSSTLINIQATLNREDLKSIAVIGKPCDIVGVRNLIKNNTIAKQKIKFLLSFMCAGLPSIKGTLNIIESFGVKEEDVRNLKYRGEGWPGYFKIIASNQQVYKKSYNESWGNELNKHLQFRCKICPDGTGEFADLTCADAWESSNDGYPSFSEKPGQSLIISRTVIGREILEDAIRKNYIVLSSTHVGLDSVKKMQPYQVNRKQNLLPRIFALMVIGKRVHLYNRKILLMAAFKENPLRLAKNFLGTLKRMWN